LKGLNVHDDIIKYQLIKTKQRLTFDILFQREDTIYRGPDDGDYYLFIASNGYELHSRSRMDIHTERLWLLGAKENSRSGSTVYSSDEKRDKAYDQFVAALTEWAEWVRATGGHAATGWTKVVARKNRESGQVVVLQRAELDQFPSSTASSIPAAFQRFPLLGAFKKWLLGIRQP
jgi:hypothetical protein